jgi:hypothetical protein
VSSDIALSSARADRLIDVETAATRTPEVGELLSLACRALPFMHRNGGRDYVQTVRRDDAAPGGLRPEGDNLRYAAIVALGAAQLPPERQLEVLGGLSATALSAAIVERGLDSADPGAAALTTWAAAEVSASSPDLLLDRLAREISAATPIPTVDYAWTLTALLAAAKVRDVSTHTSQAVDRLLAAQGANGIFPHVLPRQTLNRLRAHVGCFADQVYPIQALSRYYAHTGEQRALDAAERCAASIVGLQGSAGQWWWHYDVRTGGIGSVVEGYPVYSVHQHAMGPMALFELQEAGGTDYREAINLGRSWLATHPETGDELLDPATGAIWRKVGRREPPKAMRSLRSTSTAVSPRLRLGFLDSVLRPGPVDHECRPYELGWLLYAWLSDGVAAPR